MDNNVNNTGNQTPGKAVAALILGIASIVTSCGGLGLICAIIDLVLCGQLGNEYPELPQQAKVGKILGIIGLVLSIIALIVWIVWIIVGVTTGVALFDAFNSSYY